MLNLRVIGVDSFQCLRFDKPRNYEMFVRIPIERCGPESFKIKNLHKSPDCPRVECYLPDSASVNEEKRGRYCSFVWMDLTRQQRARLGPALSVSHARQASLEPADHQDTRGHHDRANREHRKDCFDRHTRRQCNPSEHRPDDRSDLADRRGPARAVGAIGAGVKDAGAAHQSVVSSDNAQGAEEIQYEKTSSANSGKCQSK